jgi:hypothetical protein
MTTGLLLATIMEPQAIASDDAAKIAKRIGGTSKNRSLK